MINVSRENELAAKLETTAKEITEVINDYITALSEISKNSSNSSKKISKKISDNINKLQTYRNRLYAISNTIRTKAQEIRNQQEKELKRRQECQNN